MCYILYSMNTLITKIRKRANLTQQAMADQIGVGQSTIANYESGIRAPRPQHAKKIIELGKALGIRVRLDDLY